MTHLHFQSKLTVSDRCTSVRDLSTYVFVTHVCECVMEKKLNGRISKIRSVVHWCIKQKSRVVKPKSLREWDIYSMNSVYKMSIYMNVHKIQKRKNAYAAN